MLKRLHNFFTKKNRSPRTVKSLLSEPKASNENKTYRNDATFLENSISKIPTKNLFISDDQYAFDVTELLKTWEENHGLINSYTRTIFSLADREKLGKYSLVSDFVLALKNRIDNQSRLIDEEIINAVKIFVHEFYKNDSDAIKSTAAYGNFLQYVNTLPDNKINALKNYLIITKDKVSTFGKLLEDIEATEECAHNVSYLLWKFVSDFDNEFIASESKNISFHTYADPRLWKRVWDDECLTTKQKLTCLGIDANFTTHHPLPAIH